MLSLVPFAHAAEVKVRAVVGQSTIYHNVPFTFAIEVDGADGEVVPDLTPLADYAVVSRGASSRSQTSRTYDSSGWRTIENKVETHNYTLTPRQAGSQRIPAIRVKVGDKVLSTQAIAITVGKPREVDDFKLQFSLDKKRCYVGQTLQLTMRWLIGAEVQGFEFNLPILNDERFFLHPKEIEPGADLQNKVKIPIADGEVIATKGRQSYKGRDYVSITLDYIFIPRQAGDITLPSSSLTLRALQGYSQPSRHDPFTMFGRQKTYQTMVIPANELSLEVLPLPAKGRPANFSGLVGKFSLATLASPTTANVGDPLTLTTTISGDYVEHVRAEHLDLALSAPDFKLSAEVPEEASGRGVKSFTHVIRAKHDGVTMIPAQRLSFFNPHSASYEQAKSAAIALEVRPTRIVTARDAEGDEAAVVELDKAQGGGPQAVVRGIRHNYENISFASQANGGANWFWLVLVAGPALALLGLLVRRRRRGNQGGDQRQRVKRALKELHKGRGGAVPFFAYLAARLGLGATSITWHDVAPCLEQHGVDNQLQEEVAAVFTGQDARRYGGAGQDKEDGVDVEQLLALARRLEGVLK